jgi:hypothetical protein
VAITVYKVYNAAMPTTAAIAKLATGTAIKTHIQLAPPTNRDVMILGWGVSFDSNAAGVSITCELCETDVAATSLTAHVAAGLVNINNPGLSNSLCQLGTALTGWGAGAEGTITAVRMGDAQLVQPTNQFIYDWILGYEFVIRAGKFGRIRITTGTTVNCLAYMLYTE